ncbi:MAG: orotate phosphoribosyltransferase, partial [Planctomycetes bacterium]|nr:orotate phosphoribosyltransferase [Planctomycetota bacterium]
MERTELARRIRESAYLEGDFTLRSGRKSKYYLDKYLFETQPDILLELGKMFAAHAQDSTTRIAGAEPGG